MDKQRPSKIQGIPNRAKTGRESFTFFYRTTGKIIVLNILIFKFLDSRREDKRFCTEW
jgi:hypothetical protein